MREINQIKIPIIDSERKYWLVRSNGGKYYHSYKLNDYIGIGWNKINQNYLNKKGKVYTEDIREFYKPKNEENKKNYGLIAGQLNRFIYEMKKGDIVITPSESSEYVAFGTVVDDEIYHEDKLFDVNKPKKGDKEYCPHVKRRKVKWLNTVKKDNLDPHLYKLFFTHLTVSEVKSEKYATFIDRTIDSLFVKGNQAHIVLKVEQKSKVQADLMIDLIGKTLDSLDSDFEHVRGVSRKNVDIKLNVQSPGPVEFIGPVQDILLLSSFIFSTFYGGITYLKSEYEDEEKKNQPALKDTLEAVNKDHEKEYERKVQNHREQIYEKLKVKNPAENINSIKEKETKL